MNCIKVLGAAGALCIGAATAFAAEVAPAEVDEDGGAAIVESESAEAAKTFETCFNAKLYKQGAVVDYVVRRSSGGKTVDANFVYSVGKTKKFQGVNATEVNIKISSKGFSELLQEYYTIKDGDLLKHGLKGGGAVVTYKPAELPPLDLAPKGKSTQKYVAGVAYNGDEPEYAKAKRTVTFNGFESLTTPVGSIKTCKLTKKTVLSVDGFPQPIATQNEVEWYAAEGKYRGFKLKVNFFGRADGQDYSHTLTAIKFNKYAVK